MTDDLVQRAARHRPDPNWEGTPSYCIACSIDDGEAFHDVLWPCLVHDLAAALAAEQAARARERAALQTMLKASEDEAVVSFHDLDGSCNCRMCTELIPMMRAVLAGEDAADGR